MKESTRNLVVGFTALAGLIGFCALLLLFGYVPEWADRGYGVTITMTDAEGLRPESRVQLAGVDIGSIRSVEIAENPLDGVVILAWIDPDVRLSDDVKVDVRKQMFGGSATLSMQPVSDNGDLLPTDGSATLAAGKATGNAFDRMADGFDKLTGEWAKVAQNLNLMLEPRTVGDVDTGDKQANLASLLSRTDERMAEMKNLITNLNAVVGDKQLREDLRATMSNTRKASGRFDELIGSYVNVADQLGETVTELRKSLAKINKGQGTAGKLVNDPELYDNLNAAAVRLEQLLSEGRQLIEKFKTEGLPLNLE